MTKKIITGHVRLENNLAREISNNCGLDVLGLYSILLSYRNTNTNKCFPSMSFLAKEVGLSKKTIERKIKLLTENNFILVGKSSSGRNNQYYFPRENFYNGEVVEIKPVKHTVKTQEQEAITNVETVVKPTLEPSKEENNKLLIYQFINERYEGIKESYIDKKLIDYKGKLDYILSLYKELEYEGVFRKFDDNLIMNGQKKTDFDRFNMHFKSLLEPRLGEFIRKAQAIEKQNEVHSQETYANMSEYQRSYEARAIREMSERQTKGRIREAEQKREAEQNENFSTILEDFLADYDKELEERTIVNNSTSDELPESLRLTQELIEKGQYDEMI